MGHNHSHSGQVSEKRLGLSIGLNLVITLAEFAGGIFSNSLALLSDAVHNLSDTISLILAYIAQKIGRREHNEKQTFGYKRAEILAAFLNAVALIVISLYLVYEAIQRLKDPQSIHTGIMLWVALVGLMANLFSVILLQRDATGNLNIRSAYLHLIGDTLSSVVVIAGALAIRYFNILWLDPVLTMVISLFILKETYGILVQATGILMESSPPDLDIDAIKNTLEQLDEVDNVHHIHAWRISDHETHFQCHVDISSDLPLSETDRIRIKMEKMIMEKYPVHHVTIQMEYNTCQDKNPIAHMHSHDK